MSGPSSQGSVPSTSNATNPNHDHDPAEVPRLKRQIAAMQEELEEIHNSKAKKPPTTITMGWGVRRLVTLFDSLEDLIDEADHQLQDNEDDAESDNEEFVDNETWERKRESRLKFAAYTTLLQVLPCVKTMIENPHISPDELTTFLIQLQKGANDARSDDVRRIKEEIALWLNDEFTPVPPMLVKARSDRGVQSRITGRLLCPIEHDWDDEHVRSAIQAGSVDISEDFFLRCLYPHGNGDPDNVERIPSQQITSQNLFFNIYFSSSSDAFDNEDEMVHLANNRKPLAFNLTDATQWVEVYGQFNFRALYAFIVDFFEDSAGPAAAARTASLLKWWNKYIDSYFWK
ncbi:hypothetical protein BJ912DRAFT_1060825 [Pholiota molesta]|nr:hypothetical protein BJ912DRAFT_1060825 [Pholiota molesta]